MAAVRWPGPATSAYWQIRVMGPCGVVSVPQPSAASDHLSHHATRIYLGALEYTQPRIAGMMRGGAIGPAEVVLTPTMTASICVLPFRGISQKGSLGAHDGLDCSAMSDDLFVQRQRVRLTDVQDEQDNGHCRVVSTQVKAATTL